jgi:UDP-N-acetylmuramoyl-tripeptide--D-alanyl-D-alanine ligase
MLIEDLYKIYLSSNGVTTDTRNIQPGTIFFALKGDNFNANHFAAEALEKGASFAVVDEIAETTGNEKYTSRLIQTENVLKTLQQLAGYHRRQLKCPVLAITGSNGKTTTKELVAAVLGQKFKTYATKGNLNNHIGVPLTLLAIKQDVEFAVIEMGANHQGEIASYCEYTRPGYGLITNVGMAHTEGFGGFEGVVKGKTELYVYLSKNQGKVFVNAGNKILLAKLKELKITELITYGKPAHAFCSGQSAGDDEFLSLSIADKSADIVIQTNLVGDYNFENVLSAVCIGKYFGVEMAKIKSAVETYMPSNNRSQKITFGTNTVIMDAYNANPSSMQVALQNFEKTQAPHKIAILGEMMELGSFAAGEHKKIAAIVAQMHVEKRIFVGKGFEFLKTEPDTAYFETSAQLKDWFRSQKFDNYYILVKGSRKNELEKIFKD